MLGKNCIIKLVLFFKLAVQMFIPGTRYTWWCGNSTRNGNVHFTGTFFKIALTLNSFKPKASRGKAFCLIY